MSCVFKDKDIISIILSFRSINDNLKYSYIDKLINECSTVVLKNQVSIRRFFIRFKNKTIFSKPKLKKTYYTLKNKYINREERDILFF